MKKEVCFVVVTYNAMKWIERCIRSIYNNGCNEIIIIDNNSIDATVSFIRKNFPNIDLIQSANNLGFGSANNIGIKKAIANGFDYVFLLNQDAYLKTDALSCLVDFARNHSDVGIVSPLHLNGAGNFFDQNFTYSLTVRTNNNFLNDLYFNRVKACYEVSFVNAAAWLVRRACIEKVGLFDPLFFHYGEDDNYCQRVLYHGYKIAICSNAEVLHDRDDRNGQIRPEFEDESYRRGLLIGFCDPRIEVGTELASFLKRQRKQMFKALATLDIKNFGNSFRTYRYFKEKRADIIKSVNQNRINRDGSPLNVNLEGTR